MLPPVFAHSICRNPLHSKGAPSAAGAKSDWIEAEMHVLSNADAQGGWRAFSDSDRQRLQAEAGRHPFTFVTAASKKPFSAPWRPCEPSNGWVDLIGFDPGCPAPREGSLLVQQIESLKIKRDVRGLQTLLLHAGFPAEKIVLAGQKFRQQMKAGED